jgi:hypothetical protein
LNPARVRVLEPPTAGGGPVIYWMSRDQRVYDNWALLHAQELAQKTRAPVIFNLIKRKPIAPPPILLKLDRSATIGTDNYLISIPNPILNCSIFIARKTLIHPFRMTYAR